MMKTRRFREIRNRALRWASGVLSTAAAVICAWPFVALITDPHEPKLLGIFLGCFATALGVFIVAQLVSLLVDIEENTRCQKSHAEQPPAN